MRPLREKAKRTTDSARARAAAADRVCIRRCDLAIDFVLPKDDAMAQCMAIDASGAAARSMGSREREDLAAARV